MGFSAIYTTNSAQHTAFVQVSLKEGHRVGSHEYMNRVRRRIAADLPQLSAYFQSRGRRSQSRTSGLIDVQVSGSRLDRSYRAAREITSRIRRIPGVSDVFIPQDPDYPALQFDIDRTRAAELGLNQREIVHNVITALTSNTMIAPSYWIDPKTGYDYMLTVQYNEQQVKSLSDLKAIPLRSAGHVEPARLDMVSRITRLESPTEVNHHQIRRIIDIYVQPAGEELSQAQLNKTSAEIASITAKYDYALQRAVLNYQVGMQR